MKETTCYSDSHRLDSWKSGWPGGRVLEGHGLRRGRGPGRAPNPPSGLPGGTCVTACGQAAGQELDCACAVVSPGEDAVGTGCPRTCSTTTRSLLHVPCDWLSAYRIPGLPPAAVPSLVFKLWSISPLKYTDFISGISSGLASSSPSCAFFSALSCFS